MNNKNDENEHTRKNWHPDGARNNNFNHYGRENNMKRPFRNHFSNNYNRDPSRFSREPPGRHQNNNRQAEYSEGNTYYREDFALSNSGNGNRPRFMDSSRDFGSRPRNNLNQNWNEPRNRNYYNMGNGSINNNYNNNRTENHMHPPSKIMGRDFGEFRPYLRNDELRKYPSKNNNNGHWPRDGKRAPFHNHGYNSRGFKSDQRWDEEEDEDLSKRRWFYSGNNSVDKGSTNEDTNKESSMEELLDQNGESKITVNSMHNNDINDMTNDMFIPSKENQNKTKSLENASFQSNEDHEFGSIDILNKDDQPNDSMQQDEQIASESIESTTCSYARDNFLKQTTIHNLMLENENKTPNMENNHESPNNVSYDLLIQNNQATDGKDNCSQFALGVHLSNEAVPQCKLNEDVGPGDVHVHKAVSECLTMDSSTDFKISQNKRMKITLPEIKANNTPVSVMSCDYIFDCDRKDLMIIRDNILQAEVVIHQSDLNSLMEFRDKISKKIDLIENEERRRLSNIAPFIVESTTNSTQSCISIEDVFQNSFFQMYIDLTNPELGSYENVEDYVLQHLNTSSILSQRNKASFLNKSDIVDLKYGASQRIQIPSENYWSIEENATFKNLLKDGNKNFKQIAKTLKRSMKEIILHYYRTKKKMFSPVKRKAGRISDEDMKVIIKREWNEKSISLFINCYEINGKNWAAYQTKFPFKTERDMKLLYRYVAKYSSFKPVVKKERIIQNEQLMMEKYLKEFTISQRQIFALYYPFVGRNWSEMSQVVNKNVNDIRGYYRYYFKKLSPEEKIFESNLQEIVMKTYSCPASPKRKDDVEHKGSCGILFLHKKI